MSKATTPSEVVAISAKAGALPCSLLSVVGDFFSPIGFWLLPLAAGGVAFVSATVFFASESLRNKAFVTFFGPEKTRLWENPFLKSAAFWAMSTFALVGIVFGFMSMEHRQQGGVLAENLSVVSSLQRLVGINAASLEEQKKTRQATESLLKLETTGIADNPRVTLTKQGIAWSEDSFFKAISSGDADDMSLFLQGGMRFTRGSLGRAFRYYTPQVAAVIRTHADQVPTEACAPSYESMGVEVNSLRILDALFRDKNWKLDPERVNLYAAICDKPEIRHLLDDLAQKEGAKTSDAYNALRKAFPTTSNSSK
ncbi:MAG: hypothetical protein KF861_22000 [Planctomycetaceae bacterium]|uniref:hypothetical protein n=1 Tax=Dokdonella sp. TaxID=2291710 RepID=UPI0027BAFE54|nr:hypothetical protein [Dokdonella sp.]MBX3440178.1 hypothetical protein [Planctomycetaceae bacterium]